MKWHFMHMSAKSKRREVKFFFSSVLHTWFCFREHQVEKKKEEKKYENFSKGKLLRENEYIYVEIYESFNQAKRLRENKIIIKKVVPVQIHLQSQFAFEWEAKSSYHTNFHLYLLLLI